VERGQIVRILHLSDTTLSGSPIRISRLLNKHTAHESRHLVWQAKIYNRTFETDLVGETLPAEELRYWVYEWATHLHFHNRWARQTVFKVLGSKPPKLPSVIQVHSPRESNSEGGFREELSSRVPLAIIAQYHTRQWSENKFVVPNVVDITEPTYQPVARPQRRALVVSYAPSNAVCRGWDSKGYELVNPILKKMGYSREIQYQKIINKTHTECLALKQKADIGIDEVMTGSYHLSALEYLAMGIATICYIDEKTEKAIKDVTGATTFPFVHSGKGDIVIPLKRLMSGLHAEMGVRSREWMEKYWNPELLCNHYVDMYEKL
jgi:hypothetical protein